MELSTLTSRGQMTLPIAIRKAMQLRAGDKLNCFINEDDQIVLVPAKGTIEDVKGMFAKPKRAATLDDIDNAIALEAAERATCS